MHGLPDGDIWTNDLMSPDYVWFRCTTYAVPDTTNGHVGYHCCYRPLAGTRYSGNDQVTEQMRADLRQYYAWREASVLAERHRAEARQRFHNAPRRTARTLQGRPGVTIPCPHCGTYCCGDCQHAKEII